MEMIKRKYLHQFSRHTNLNPPYSKYITANKFPDQISDLLNTEVIIKYKVLAKTDIETANKAATIIRDGKVISSRPSDDIQHMEDYVIPDYIKKENPLYDEGSFIVLRADSVEPFKFIGISTDYSKMVIGSTKIINNEYLFLSNVLEYPIQMNELLGIYVYNCYDDGEILAKVLRIDDCEPLYSILIEFLENNIIRFVLGDEVKSKLFEDDKNEINRYALSEQEIINIRMNSIIGNKIYGNT